MFNTFCQGVGLVLEMKLRVGFNSLLKILWNEWTDLILKLVMIRQRWKCQIDKITLKKKIYNKNTNRLNQNLLNYIKLKISWVEVVTRKCDVGDLGQKMNWSKSGRVFTLNSERIARFLSLLCSKQIQFAQSEIILSAKIDKWDVQKVGNRNTRKILTVENCQTFTWRSEMCLQFQVCFERSGFNLRITSLQAQKVRL